MSMFTMELRLVLRASLAARALALLALCSVLAVWSGMRETGAQRASLQRIEASNRGDVALVASHYQQGGEAGYAAYSTPHLALNPPSPLAFAAIGQRDIQPSALRVRLLGLQGQLYESESVNPELALPGRFDFAFVLVYLAPLLAIALMHDLVAGERERGRLRLLASLPAPLGQTWRRRIGLRYLLVCLACMLPFVGGAVLSGVDVISVLLVLAAGALYLAFWCGLAAAVAARTSSAANAAAVLLAAFVTLTIILPASANILIGRAIPVARGVELAMAQRQEVHQAWDQPRADAMARFFKTHPEWRDTAPVTGRFHWKWYYAMQQAADDAVAPAVAAYRRSMGERERWTEHAGALLAAANVQVLIHRLAQTDLQAQMAFQERVLAYHTRLRHYFYPYIFNEKPFGPAQFAALPAFDSAHSAPALPLASLLWMALLAGIALAAGLLLLERSYPASGS